MVVVSRPSKAGHAGQVSRTAFWPPEGVDSLLTGLSPHLPSPRNPPREFACLLESAVTAELEQAVHLV